MTRIADVVSGNAVTATWGNAIRDQVVAPLASASARTSAIPSPGQGAVTYQQDTNSLEAWDGTGWTTVGRPVKALRITSTLTPMYTTSATTQLDLTKYQMTGLTALDSARYYLARYMVTWSKTVPGDDFAFTVRANTSLTGQQVGATGNVPTLTESNGAFVFEFLFKGDGGHSLSITSLFLSTVRNTGTGTLSVYGAGADNFRAWCALYDVGNSVNWTDVP